ncbi:MAG: hypothetical protein AAF288_13320 [Planctomycetota bacterium]
MTPSVVIQIYTVLAPLLFLFMRPKYAVLVVFYLGWLFLPNISEAEALNLPLFPPLRKSVAPGYAVLMGMLLFDFGKVMAFRFRTIDWLAVAFVGLPVISCFTNFEYFRFSPVRAIHGSLSLVLPNVMLYGVPYFAGRVYFSDGPGLLRLVKAHIVAGLVYVPFCLVEWRLTPQFHRWVYGYHATDFGMAMRLGGFRPRVFMWHGLMTGLFMCSTAIAATWLWVSGTAKKIAGVPIWAVAPGLIMIGILTRSTGAIALMLMALMLMGVIYLTKMRWLLLAMAMAAPLYITTRVVGWQGFELLELAEKFNEERALSLGGRMMNENVFIDKGLEKPLFGWAGWDRWHGRIDGSVSAQAARYEGHATVPDGWWVIAFGTTGFIGLGTLILYLTMPAILLVKRVPVRYWYGPAGAAAAIAVICAMLMTDSIFNKMDAHPYHMMVGAAVGTLAGFRMPSPAGQAAARRRRPGEGRRDPQQRSSPDLDPHGPDTPQPGAPGATGYAHPHPTGGYGQVQDRGPELGPDRGPELGPA